MSNEIATARTYPLLPLRDVVVVPHHGSSRSSSGRPKSIKAMEIAMEAGKSICSSAREIRGQGRAHCEDHVQDRLHSEHPANAQTPRRHLIQVLVEGSQRARIQSIG